MISSSGSDENGAYKNGKAGDQSKKEWFIRSFYERPWNCVLRYPDEKVGVYLSNLSIKAANNDKIGYDQSQRDTYWLHLRQSDYDPSKITVPCEADCSSGVIANTKAVGYLLNIYKLKNINATYTGDMRKEYRKAGFSVYTAKKYLTSEKYLRLGDILLNDVYHTAVYVGTGELVAVSGEKATTAKDYAQAFDKSIAGTYTTTADLNMREGAGTFKDIMITLPKGAKCRCYGYYSMVNEQKWLYVVSNVNNAEYTGFCSAEYLVK